MLIQEGSAIAVSISARPVSAEGNTSIVALVENVAETDNVVYDWQAQDTGIENAPWTSIDRHEQTLQLSGLTLETCEKMRYRCTVTVNDQSVTSGELKLDASGPAAVALGLSYSISGSACTITGYTGSATAVAIPSIIEGATVTAIDGNAFKNCRTLASIAIPDSVTSIGASAFEGCSSLTSIPIPKSVTDIGDFAFVNCTSLTSVQLSSGLDKIPNYMFNGCTSLKSIVIPDSVTAIMDCAFMGCTQLSDVTIPNSVTHIGDSAFSGCGNLTSITLPGELLRIRNRAFENCSLTGVTLPDKLQLIYDLAFKNCKFDTITIPDSVTALYKDFVDRDVEIIHNNNEAVKEWLKKYRSKTFDYEIDGDHCIIHNYYGKDAVVKIPSEIENVPVTIIDKGAFRDCFFVTDVTIPDTVTSIGEEAFENCSGLVNVTIPDSVTSIGEEAFENCSGLVNVTIPDSVTGIGQYAFENCTSLKTITIPDTVTSLQQGTFQNCTSLKSITIPEGVKTIGSMAFARGGLNIAVLPESLTSIADDAFGKDVIVYGVAGSYAESWCSEIGITFIADKPTVTGSASSFLDGDATVTIELWKSGSAEADYSTAVSGGTQSGNKYTTAYNFTNIPAGSYTMKVSKANHVTREYTVTVGTGAVTQDVEINLSGDINGDGKVTTLDFGKVNSHARGVSQLTGYELKCADVTGTDGKVTTADAGRINAHARGVSKLWG